MEIWSVGPAEGGTGLLAALTCSVRPMKSPPERLVMLPAWMLSMASATLALFCAFAATSPWSFEA